MSAHDPLCPVFKYPRQICECYFIAKARADELERITKAQESLATAWERLGHGQDAEALRTGIRSVRNGGSDDDA